MGVGEKHTSPSPAPPFSSDSPEGAAAHSLGCNSSGMFHVQIQTAIGTGISLGVVRCATSVSFFGITTAPPCFPSDVRSCDLHVLLHTEMLREHPLTHVLTRPSTCVCRAVARPGHSMRPLETCAGIAELPSNQVTVFKPGTLFKHSHLYLADSFLLTFQVSPPPESLP